MVFVFKILTINILNAQLSVEFVAFSGLKKTKETYLQRFLENEIGADFSFEKLEKEVQNLKNLNAVANAEFQIDTTGNDVKITYEIEEALTLFPIVNFGGVEGNVWFQLGFTDLNWLGKGMQLSAFYQNNDWRNNFSLYYRVPYIKGSRWGASVSFLKWASREPLYFDEGEVLYDYDNLSFGATTIYELGFNHNIEFGGSYFIEDYGKSAQQSIENPPGPETLQQPKALIKLLHNLNRINYHYFYLFGFLNTINIQTVNNINDGTWFNIVLNDTKFFKRIGKKGNLGGRLRLGLSTNNDTPFAPFVLDSHVNIRGAGNRIDRGTGVLVLNLEYRHTIFDRKLFAGQVVGFSDVGTWRNPGGDLGDLTEIDNLRPFAGGGIRIIYKKAFDAVLRLDYGVDLRDVEERGFVLGFGQYF
ncbi:MAG: outer membrane protein assembly factor BamA [Saprospiraceae bacterium]